MIPAKRLLAVCVTVMTALAPFFTVAAPGRGPLAVTDNLGRKVVIPAKVERIISLEPEVTRIIVALGGGERLVTVEGVLADPRLASVRAVRTGRVHYTFGFWYWWDPALVLVETAYLSWLLNPGKSQDFDLAREGEEIFKEFYGTEGLFRALCRVLACYEWNPK